MNTPLRLITDGQARRIAADWHVGMSSALYALASSGAVELDRLRNEISQELWKLELGPDRRELLALDKYVRTVGERIALPGWPDLWDETPVILDQT